MKRTIECILSKSKFGITYKSGKIERSRHLKEQLYMFDSSNWEIRLTTASVVGSVVGTAPVLRGLPTQGLGSDLSPVLIYWQWV